MQMPGFFIEKFEFSLQEAEQLVQGLYTRPAQMFHKEATETTKDAVDTKQQLVEEAEKAAWSLDPPESASKHLFALFPPLGLVGTPSPPATLSAGVPPAETKIQWMGNSFTIQQDSFPIDQLPPEEWQVNPSIMQVLPPQAFKEEWNRAHNTTLWNVKLYGKTWPAAPTTYKKAEIMADKGFLMIWQMITMMEVKGFDGLAGWHTRLMTWCATFRQTWHATFSWKCRQG